MSTTLPAHRITRIQTVAQVIDDLDHRLRTDQVDDLRPLPTGFDVVDDALGGGVRAGELLLLGGPPGVGKTALALQWARNLAAAGTTALFVCYEHEPTTLLLRLMALELAHDDEGGALANRLARLLTDGHADHLDAVLADHAAAASLLDRIGRYADRLVLVRASGAHTDLDALAGLLDTHRDTDRAVLFVDYLQKIPLRPEPDTEAEKVTRSVEVLKDLALEHHRPVVAVSAVDGSGMTANRLRLHHLRGSSALAFEADVVIMLNPKERAVAKRHLTYDPVRARGYRDWVVFSIEKNRGGPALVDLEHRKDLHHFRFDPCGRMVAEALVDERLDETAL